MSVKLTQAETEALAAAVWQWTDAAFDSDPLCEAVEKIISDRLGAREERIDRAIKRAEAQPCRIPAAHTGEVLRLALTKATSGEGLGGRWGVESRNGVTPENLRWAATHEALSRSFIFDVLTGLADALEKSDA
jgi:hypothetical protein